MQLEHSFSVPVGIDDAWQILLDIERIGPCMPGATIESVDGDDFTGSVKVKLGPINLTYKGKASFVEKDAGAHKAVIDARGRDARGNGTAAAKVTATLTESGGKTNVTVLTDLDITGKPAQFGRGVMVDVGNKLIGQFADCLAKTIGGSTSGAGAAAPAKKTAAKKAAAKTTAKTAAKATEDATEDATAGAAADSAPAKAASRPRPARPAAAAGSLSGASATVPSDAAAAADEPVSGSAPQAAAESEPIPAEAAEEGPSFTAPASVPAASEPDEEPSVNGHASSAPKAPPPEAEPIDLLASAGPAVAKRLVPVIAPVAVAAVVVLLARRRKRR